MAGSKTVKKTAEYTKRFDERYDELKWLYCELYNNNMEAFDCAILCMVIIRREMLISRSWTEAVSRIRTGISRMIC